MVAVGHPCDRVVERGSVLFGHSERMGVAREAVNSIGGIKYARRLLAGSFWSVVMAAFWDSMGCWVGFCTRYAALEGATSRRFGRREGRSENSIPHPYNVE